MKFPEWSKKQTILIGVLAGVLVCAVMLLVAIATRPAETALLDEPEDESIELVEERAVTLVEESTPPPDLSLIFRADSANPLPEDGAVLSLGEAYTIGGTVYSNYPLDTVTVTISCSHNSKKLYPYKKAVHFKRVSTGVCPKPQPTRAFRLRRSSIFPSCSSACTR